MFAQLTIIGVRAMPGIAAAERDKVSIEGLDGPVEILVDQWGIPHVYAGTVHDVFFAQGWNAGRERLWQLDLWRKRGLGRLAENFGPQYVAKDRAARLFLYRGDMDAEWAVYGPDARAWTEAFAAGLNAYIAKVLAGEAPLPVEFRLTDTRPEPWDASDVVRIRSHGISNNAEGEFIRMRIVSAGGLAADRVRRKLEPDHALALPDGLDLSRHPGRPAGRLHAGHQGRGVRPARRRARQGRRAGRSWSRRPPRAAPTTGRSPARARPPAGRSWPAIRTGCWSRPRSVT